MGAKAGYCACPLYSTPPKGWAKHLSHPSGQTPGHTPTLTPYRNELVPPWGACKGACYLFSLPPAVAGAPVKPCLKKKKRLCSTITSSLKLSQFSTHFFLKNELCIPLLSPLSHNKQFILGNQYRLNFLKSKYIVVLNVVSQTYHIEEVSVY